MKTKNKLKPTSVIAMVFVLAILHGALYAQKGTDGFFKNIVYYRDSEYDITLQNFDLYEDPYGLDIQNFGETVPIGEDLAVLVISGMCYVIRKRKNIKK